MKNSIVFTLLFFFWVFLPITLINAAYIFFTSSCDPKFGCLGTFQLLTFIVSCCAFVASIAALLVHYLLVSKPNVKLSKINNNFSKVFASLLGFSTYYAVALMENIEIAGTVFLYFFVSCVINSVIFSLKKI
ncbi:hypothetical protein [Paraglaciecola arctica]|uniref:hypothetical protein n=1 Tax=Paraglaciecola arctica TaxID=1128911 RepID=UPI001C071C13|nr:hypothetical protein [Paraglaciecola arctica]MBU3006164.1 hypothetical protein [Paraglaciecola arctica]